MEKLVINNITYELLVPKINADLHKNDVLKKYKITFEVHNRPSSFSSAIRRIVLSELPTPRMYIVDGTYQNKDPYLKIIEYIDMHKLRAIPLSHKVKEGQEFEFKLNNNSEEIIQLRIGNNRDLAKYTNEKFVICDLCPVKSIKFKVRIHYEIASINGCHTCCYECISRAILRPGEFIIGDNYLYENAKGGDNSGLNFEEVTEGFSNMRLDAEDLLTKDLLAEDLLTEGGAPKSKGKEEVQESKSKGKEEVREEVKESRSKESKGKEEASDAVLSEDVNRIFTKGLSSMNCNPQDWFVSFVHSGELTPHELIKLIKSSLVARMENIRTILNTMEHSGNVHVMNIDNESYTVGCLLEQYMFAENPKIYCTFKVPIDERRCTFEIRYDDEKAAIDAMNVAIDNIIDDFIVLEKELLAHIK
jgi:hypothetical protein